MFKPVILFFMFYLKSDDGVALTIHKVLNCIFKCR